LIVRAACFAETSFLHVLQDAVDPRFVVGEALLDLLVRVQAR
jgi:hypothetical protein